MKIKLLVLLLLLLSSFAYAQSSENPSEPDTGETAVDENAQSEQEKLEEALKSGTATITTANAKYALDAINSQYDLGLTSFDVSGTGDVTIEGNKIKLPGSSYDLNNKKFFQTGSTVKIENDELQIKLPKGKEITVPPGTNPIVLGDGEIPQDEPVAITYQVGDKTFTKYISSLDGSTDPYLEFENGQPYVSEKRTTDVAFGSGDQPLIIEGSEDAGRERVYVDDTSKKNYITLEQDTVTMAGEGFTARIPENDDSEKYTRIEMQEKGLVATYTQGGSLHVETKDDAIGGLLTVNEKWEFSHNHGTSDVKLKEGYQELNAQYTSMNTITFKEFVVKQEADNTILTYANYESYFGGEELTSEELRDKIKSNNPHLEDDEVDQYIKSLLGDNYDTFYGDDPSDDKITVDDLSRSAPLTYSKDVGNKRGAINLEELEGFDDPEIQQAIKRFRENRETSSDEALIGSLILGNYIDAEKRNIDYDASYGAGPLCTSESDCTVEATNGIIQAIRGLSGNTDYSAKDFDAAAEAWLKTEEGRQYAHVLKAGVTPRGESQVWFNYVASTGAGEVVTANRNKLVNSDGTATEWFIKNCQYGNCYATANRQGTGYGHIEALYLGDDNKVYMIDSNSNNGEDAIGEETFRRDWSQPNVLVLRDPDKLAELGK